VKAGIGQSIDGPFITCGKASGEGRQLIASRPTWPSRRQEGSSPLARQGLPHLSVNWGVNKGGRHGVPSRRPLGASL